MFTLETLTTPIGRVALATRDGEVWATEFERPGPPLRRFRDAHPGAQFEAPPEPTYWPLTGLERKGDAPRHPIVVTKVDNTSSSAPQVGLGSADLVVEELVEGGYTRLAAFYYSKVPAAIGPVRSMRASDIGIVPPGATVVTSGAAPVTINRINGAGIPWITEGAAGVYRETSRSAPYNLFAKLGGKPDVVNPALSLRVTVSPTPDGMASGSMDSFQLTYSCPPSE